MSLAETPTDCPVWLMPLVRGGSGAAVQWVGMTGDRRRRNEGMRWMPRHGVPMKDVGSCEKHRGAGTTQ